MNPIFIVIAQCGEQRYQFGTYDNAHAKRIADEYKARGWVVSIVNGVVTATGDFVEATS